MPYTPPAGNAADFKTPNLDFPRNPLGLVFPFKDDGYTPASGGSIVARWHVPPADYVRPLGNAADFSMSAAPSIFTGSGAVSVPITADGAGQFKARISLRSGVFGSWGKAARSNTESVSPHLATQRLDEDGAGRWAASAPIDCGDAAPWGSVTKADADESIKWGKFGDLSAGECGSTWKPTKRTDESRRSLWDIFGEMLNEDRGSKWKGSKPADKIRVGEWRGHFNISRRQINYIPPGGSSADFSTVGGGGLLFKFSGADWPATHSAISLQFGAGSYSPPPLRAPGVADFIAPSARALDFTYSPQFEVILDGSGNPSIDKAEINTHGVAPWGVSIVRDKEAAHPWLKYSRPLNPGWGIVVPPGPVTPEPGEQIIIPVQRVYIVVNEIILARVDDSTPIPASQLSISFDCDSWLPSFLATIPETSRDAIMPDPSPVEVYAYINGSEFRFFVEKINRSRQFGQRSVSISGRGIACELDAPYAAEKQHTNGTAMNAQQIIDAALEFTTYTQTWNITDWLVPAGVFSLYGTPAAVAANVAEASGSVLAADWALRDLRMLPRYPVKPWDWPDATPDIIIPSSITQTESLEWVERPAYNVVYVSGVQQGIIGQVKITGTAGDTPAPMVTHPLITHANAARQRGVSILGNTGRKALMQISMPVLESTGVIDICRLIEFSDGAETRRGIVRANNVSVNYPTVRQTLTIEAEA